MLGKDLEESRLGVNAWWENEVRTAYCAGEEEDNRWGTKGYKYPQIQNSNGYIPEFGTSEKNLGTSDLWKSLLTVARTVGTSEKKLGTSEQQIAEAKQ
jgi:hypothetical protein